MEVQQLSVLLLIIVDISYLSCEKQSVLLPTLAQPCFVSCSCDSENLIKCTADADFTLKVNEFNHFLRNFSMGMKTLVHIETNSVSLPSFLPKMPLVQYLSLSENAIELVQGGVLKGMRLVELNVSHNNVERIEPGAFQDLVYLQALDLSHNKLVSVSKHVLTDLPYLEVLNLDCNQLIFFPFDAFSQIPRLQVLSLNNNHLTYLEPGSLVSLPAIQSLALRNNSLQFMAVDFVEEMPHLRAIDLSNNPFHCSCSFGGLEKMINSSSVTLLESDQMTCFTPLGFRGRPLAEVDFDLQECRQPRSVMKDDSWSVLYSSDVELSCDVQGDPDPAVLWTMPWGDRFIHPSHLSRLEAVCQSCLHERSYFSPAVHMESKVSVVGGGKTLRITHFRGFFNGNITCQAYNYLGNDSVVHHVEVKSAVPDCVLDSIVIGGFSAAGFLCFGLLVGSIKLLVLACRARFGQKRKITHTRTTTAVVSFGEENTVFSEETTFRDASVDFNDDFYPPETPFTTPSFTSPTISPYKVCTPATGQGTPPVGWRPANILETMEEVRERLRQGVGRKMKSVRRNVQSIKKSGRRNVQSIKESSSTYMHNIMETGSTAASKVKAGMVLGMVTVKSHVQSIREFCGTGDMGAHTVSAMSVETDVDTNETTTIVKSVTMV